MTLTRTAAVTAVLVTLLSTWATAQERAEQPQRRRQMMERMMRDDGAPKVGDVAPTFKLQSVDGKLETDLAAFKGKKPVLLIFGSYT